MIFCFLHYIVPVFKPKVNLINDNQTKTSTNSSPSKNKYCWLVNNGDGTPKVMGQLIWTFA